MAVRRHLRGEPAPLGGGVREGLRPKLGVHGVARHQHAGSPRRSIELRCIHHECREHDRRRTGRPQRGRQHDVIRLKNFTINQRDARRIHRGDRRVEAHRHAEALEIAGQGFDQAIHPADDSGDGRARRRGIAHPAHAVRERSGGEHRRTQSGRDDIHIEFVGMPRVDAKGHGRDQPFEHPSAHPAAHQPPEIAFLGCGESEYQLIELAAQRRPKPDDRDHISRQWSAGDAENAGARQRISAALRGLKPCSLRIRRGDFGLESELAGKFGHGVAAGGEALGARIQRQSRHRVTGDLAAEVVGSLDERDVEAAEHEIAGHHEPGDSSSDDDRVRHARWPVRGRAARCA